MKTQGVFSTWLSKPPAVLPALLGALWLLFGCQPADSDRASDTTAGDRPEGWPETFRIGVFAGDDVIGTAEQQKILSNYISEQIGIPVRLNAGTTYTTVIEAMRAKRVEAMAVGPFAHCFAQREAGAEALVARVLSEDEPAVFNEKYKPYYFSWIITKKGSGIRTLQDLKGKNFSFVDPASTSGHLFPKSSLIKAGLNPENDLKSVFAGTHAGSVLSVWNGKVDAGACFGMPLWQLHSQGHVKFNPFPDGRIDAPRTAEEIAAQYEDAEDGDLVIIAQSAPIPRTPMAVRSDIPGSLKSAVRKALSEVKKHPELVRELKRWYVDPTEVIELESADAFYDPVREVAKLLGLDLSSIE